jgi:hypothetical protein
MKTIAKMLRRRKATLLAVVVALTLLGGSTALAGTGVGGVFNLGKTNTVNAITKLVGGVPGAGLVIDNNSTDPAATALNLQVEPGKAPMKVNSNTRVANLNAASAGQADSAENAANANALNGKPSTAFLGSSLYENSASFTGIANGYDITVVHCDFPDKALSGGYFLEQKRYANSKVTTERTVGSAYTFEVLSEAVAETGTIYVLCADQDGDGAGTASASTVKDAEAPLKQTRDARK